MYLNKREKRLGLRPHTPANIYGTLRMFLPIDNSLSKPNPWNGLDARTRNIDQVQFKKTTAILKTI